MQCKICQKETKKIFKAMILNKYNINYFYCSNCEFLQTEEPFWLDEAYKNPINISDTGYLSRNICLSKKLTILLSLIFNKKAKFLDYAAGYGVLVRLMRDIGFDFYWSDKYTQNLFARGFEGSLNSKYEAVTIFECFEHFLNPLQEMENLLKFSENIIFTTELLPSSVPGPSEWWYYGLDHGQHIAFYSVKTLNYIAAKYNLLYYNLGGLYLFSRKTIPFYTKEALKLTKLGFDSLLKRTLKSKTWDDHLNVTKQKK